jgi:hypothetical protein
MSSILNTECSSPHPKHWWLCKLKFPFKTPIQFLRRCHQCLIQLLKSTQLSFQLSVTTHTCHESIFGFLVSNHKHFSSTGCALHAPLTTFSSIWSPYNIWWRLQTMQLLIVQFSPPSCHFIPLRYKYSPMHPVRKACQRHVSSAYGNFVIQVTAFMSRWFLNQWTNSFQTSPDNKNYIPD